MSVALQEVFDFLDPHDMEVLFRIPSLKRHVIEKRRRQWPFFQAFAPLHWMDNDHAPRLLMDRVPHKVHCPRYSFTWDQSEQYQTVTWNFRGEEVFDISSMNVLLDGDDKTRLVGKGEDAYDIWQISLHRQDFDDPLDPSTIYDLVLCCPCQGPRGAEERPIAFFHWGAPRKRSDFHETCNVGEPPETIVISPRQMVLDITDRYDYGDVLLPMQFRRLILLLNPQVRYVLSSVLFREHRYHLVPLYPTQ